MSVNNKAQKIVENIIQKTVNVFFESNVSLNEVQQSALQNLNVFSVNQTLKNQEALRDPRKIPYLSNLEMKYALTAICLAGAVTDPKRRNLEKKEFFQENISVYSPREGIKFIDFGKINPKKIQESIYPEIVEDWKIYRDSSGFGIKSLIDEKTNLVGLDNFRQGGDPIYEFARCYRRLAEQQNKKTQIAKDSAQEAFRNAIVQSLANKYTEQQLLSGKSIDDMMNMVGSLFGNNPKPQQIESRVEQNITHLLEYDNQKER